MKELTISYDDYIVRFRTLIKSLGLNNSTQREYVLKVLFESEEHLGAEDILNKVKEEYNVNIGIATVYRIVNLLEEMKIINSITLIGNDSKVYELNLSSHHDHMICMECEKIVEFYDDELEKIQENIAKDKGFKLQSHTMMLYGICSDCLDDE